jgi:peptidoglycan/LPS O-acetylase OafA/YrhL
VVTTKPAARLGHLDGLRGIAALLVVISHSLIAVDAALLSGQIPDSRNDWDIWLSGTPFFPFDNAGNLSVCIFFILSGYVLSQSYSATRQSWPALAVRRFVRLIIPMLAGCLAAWVLIALHLLRNQQAAAITHSGWLTAQYLQRPHFFTALAEPFRFLAFRTIPLRDMYDSSLWTMSVEGAGSLLLMTLFCTRLRRIWTALVLVVLLVALHGDYICLFCAGALWFMVHPGRPWLNNIWLILAALLAGIWLGTLPYSPSRWQIYTVMCDWAAPFMPPASSAALGPAALFHALGAMIIVITVSIAPPLQKFLAQPWATYLGKISFPLYVFHVPLIMVTECETLILANRAGLPAGLGAVLGIAVGIGGGLAAAALITPWLEPAALAASASAGRAVERLMPKRLLRWKLS